MPAPDYFQADAYDEADREPVNLLARIRSGAWLDAQEFPPLQWSVPGLVPEGFGIVVGPPKLGKSWFVLGLGLAVALGGYAVGKIGVDQRPVLYAALEDGDRRMQSRARKLLEEQPIPAEFQYFTQASPNEILPILTAWLNQHPNGLVLLDTLGKVMPPAKSGESAYARDYRVGGALKALTDEHPGSTLLVVHHNRKQAGGDWMDSTSGTQGLNGSADFTIVLERARNEGEAVLKVTGRDVMENEYAMTMDGGAWAIQGATLADAANAAKQAMAATGVGDDSAKVLAFIAAHPEGVTPTKVAAYMGWPDKKATSYLSRLCDSGRIYRPRRGLYTPVVTGVSEVFGDEDAA